MVPGTRVPGSQSDGVQLYCCVARTRESREREGDKAFCLYIEPHLCIVLSHDIMISPHGHSITAVLTQQVDPEYAFVYTYWHSSTWVLRQRKTAKLEGPAVNLLAPCWILRTRSFAVLEACGSKPAHNASGSVMQYTPQSGNTCREGETNTCLRSTSLQTFASL